MTIIHDTLPVRQQAPSDTLAVAEDRAYEFILSSKAPATLRAYASDWRHFSGWCEAHGLQALPASPRTVASYLSAHAGQLKVSTLGRRLTTISQAHQAGGHETPTTHSSVRAVWKGIRRTYGTAHSKKQALETSDIRSMVGLLGDRLIDVRDRALILVGFAGALRRSELVALDVEDVEDTADGLVVTIRRSKTDQEGHGVRLGLPYGSDPATCPVRALRAWMVASGVSEGALFRRVDRHSRMGGRMSGRAYAERLKLLAGRCGHDPAVVAGHSTRRGFITSAARSKVHERDIMRHSRHKSLAVFRGYIEEAGLFEDNAAAGVGL